MNRLTGHPNAIESLLTGLIDYAGLYPPSSLDMRTAVSNYLAYRRGAHAGALGRFVINLDRVGELRGIAGDEMPRIPLSVIISPETDLRSLTGILGEDAGGAAFECRLQHPSEIERIHAQLPAQCERYFEIPVGVESDALLDEIAASGGRAKLRMGGVVAEAIPGSKAVALMLSGFAQRRIPFKATAGLHYPIRSRHRLTEKPGSPSRIMHGFLNLAFAAVVLHFGGAAGEALKTLDEQDPGAWRIEPGAIRCRSFVWTPDQLAEMRKEFFISFGSCSFEEPMRELEVMGWL